MKSTLRAVRAIAAEYAQRFIRPPAIAGICLVSVLLIAGTVLVTIVSAWWWLLLAPVIVLCLVFIVLLVAVWSALRTIGSAQSREQKQAVRGYTDRLQRVTEDVGMPWPMVAVRVIVDLIRPRPDGFVGRLSSDGKALAPEFIKLVRLFGPTDE